MNKTLLTKANSEEEHTVAASFVSLITKSAYADDKLALLSTILSDDNNEFTLALNKKLGSDKTPEITELKELREQALKAFFKTVYGWTYRLDKDLSDDAKKIYEVIERHGITMYNLPHKEQTSKVYSMFKDLSTQDKVAALGTTGTAPFLEDIKTIQTNLSNTVDERTITEAEKEELALVTEIRKTVRIDMENILKYLDSIVDLPGDDNIKNLHTEIFDVIAEANSMIRARITRKDNGSEDEI